MYGRTRRPDTGNRWPLTAGAGVGDQPRPVPHLDLRRIGHGAGRPHAVQQSAPSGTCTASSCRARSHCACAYVTISERYSAITAHGHRCPCCRRKPLTLNKNGKFPKHHPPEGGTCQLSESNSR